MNTWLGLKIPLGCSLAWTVFYWACMLYCRSIPYGSNGTSHLIWIQPFILSGSCLCKVHWVAKFWNILISWYILLYTISENCYFYRKKKGQFGKNDIQCCGSGSGIRCRFDPWIRDPGFQTHIFESLVLLPKKLSQIWTFQFKIKIFEATTKGRKLIFPLLCCC
jgi:hypothetical protein